MARPDQHRKAPPPPCGWRGRAFLAKKRRGAKRGPREPRLLLLLRRARDDRRLVQRGMISYDEAA